MTKPQPRRSALAGQSVINQATAKPLTTPSPKPVAPKKQKITINIDEEVANTARGIYMTQVAQGGPTSFGGWIEQAIRHYINTTANQIDGPAPQAPPGALPSGPLPSIN